MTNSFRGCGLVGATLGNQKESQWLREGAGLERTTGKDHISSIPDPMSFSICLPFLQSSFPCYKDDLQPPIVAYSSTP